MAVGGVSSWQVENMSPAFLTELARARPDPGGGAAAAYGARVGLALVAKVIHLELQRPNREAPEVLCWRALLARGSGSSWRTCCSLSCWRR
jgi:hypothetical protein